jgi:hypothetical protein
VCNQAKCEEMEREIVFPPKFFRVSDAMQTEDLKPGKV